MLAIQLDDRAVFLDRWHERLLALLEHSAGHAAARSSVRKALEDWDGHASICLGQPIGSFAAWRNEVKDTVLDGFAAAVRVHYPDFELPKLGQAEHAVWMLLQRRPPNLLPPGYPSWDDTATDLPRPGRGTPASAARRHRRAHLG